MIYSFSDHSFQAATFTSEQFVQNGLQDGSGSSLVDLLVCCPCQKVKFLELMAGHE